MKTKFKQERRQNNFFVKIKIFTKKLGLYLLKCKGILKEAKCGVILKEKL